MLCKFPGHLLSCFLSLEIGALLTRAVARKAIDIDIAGLQLWHQLCDKDSRSDVVTGEDEDITAIGNAAEPSP